MPRPAGAASRLVALQTPPSTYSRPPISTGANSHGTLHEAATASATVARRRPGAPEHDPPSGAAVDGGHPQPPVEPGAGLRDVLAQAVERLLGRGSRRSSAAAREGSAGRGEPERERRERGGRGERQLAGHARGTRTGDAEPAGGLGGASGAA